MQETIKPGDLILLATEEGKTYLVYAEKKAFQTHKDSFDLGLLLGHPWGTRLKGQKGTYCFALRPTLHDHLMKLKRVTQIIYPKDIGYILLKLDIGPGKVVLECGTGSGALLLALAHSVGLSGKVITYEKEKRFQEVALSNAKRVGLLDRIVFKDIAVNTFEEEEEIDAVFLDLKTPWELLPAAWKALKGGAPLGILLPTTNQVSETLKQLQQLPFTQTEVVELFIRFYKTNPQRLRPEDRMVGHTGFLIFSRKYLP